MLDDRNLIRRLIVEIRTFLDGQKKQIETIAEYAKAQNKPSEPQPSVEVERVRNEVHFPPEIINRYHAEQNKTYRLQSRTFWIGLITLIVLAVYTLFTIKMYRANRDSADAATGAANTAANALDRSIEQFRMDERAWIEIEPIKPILMAETSRVIGSAIYRYPIYPKNVGRTAARNIVVRAQNYLTDASFGYDASMVRSAQDKILMGTYSPKKLKVPLYPMPHVIAPGAVSTVPFTLVGQDDNTGKAVFLIGRIDYIDEFQIPHWLRFCFYVTNINGELGNCQEGNDEDRNPEIEPTKKK